jgi:hypothetical protein
VFSTIFSPVGTVRDRIAMLKLARQVGNLSFEEIFDQPEEKTSVYLQSFGFSSQFIQSFFVPFFAGACLDRKITASSRVLKYVFRLFSMGDAALPSGGMGEIPRQLSSGAAAERILMQRRVVAAGDGFVQLDNGEKVYGRKIVLATAEPVVKKLLNVSMGSRSVGESCVYFSASWKPPFSAPFLVLNGEGHGPVNNIAFPSMVAPRYAPSGKTLIAAVVLGDSVDRSDLETAVRHQCREWFGSAVDDWEHIRTYRIEHALPDQTPPTANPYHEPQPLNSLIIHCGEYQSLPGLQWALISGERAGRRVQSQM